MSKSYSVSGCQSLARTDLRVVNEVHEHGPVLQNMPIANIRDAAKVLERGKRWGINEVVRVRQTDNTLRTYFNLPAQGALKKLRVGFSDGWRTRKTEVFSRATTMQHDGLIGGTHA